VTPFVAPVFGKVALIPLKPRSGSSLRLAFNITGSTGQLLATGKLKAGATLAGKRLRYVGATLTGGKGKVTILIPKKTKGKLLVIALTVSNGSQTTSNTIRYRIG